MEIIIDKNKIYEYAMALTAQVGKSTGLYDSVAITRDNYPMLDVYLSQALTHVEGYLIKHLKSSQLFNIKADELTTAVSLDDGLRPDPANRNLVESCIRLATAMYVASLWLQTTEAKDHATTYAEEAVRQLATSLTALVSKKLVSLTEEDYEERKADDVKLATNWNERHHCVPGCTSYHENQPQ